MSERRERETTGQSRVSGVTDQGNGAERICRISPLQGRGREQGSDRPSQARMTQFGVARDGWRGRGSGRGEACIASEGDVGEDWAISLVTLLMDEGWRLKQWEVQRRLSWIA